MEDGIIFGFDVLTENVGIYVPKRSRGPDGKPVKGLEGITDLKSRMMMVRKTISRF